MHKIILLSLCMYSIFKSGVVTSVRDANLEEKKKKIKSQNGHTL